LLVLGFAALIALLGAAGTQFILAYLTIQKIRREQGGGATGLQTGRMSQEWRRYRHPHLDAERPPQAKPFAAAMRQNAYGFVFLFAAFALMALLFRAL